MILVLEQVLSHDYILVINGPNFTKVVWIMRPMILMHLTG